MPDLHFFHAVGEVLRREGFRPSGTEEGTSIGLTLHEAIRRTLRDDGSRLDSDVADVGFWEWEEIRSFLNSVWTALDKVALVQPLGRHSALAWAHQSERTLQEVLSLLEDAEGVTLPPVPTATRRPVIAGIPQSGKTLGSILETLAVIHEFTGTPYGDLLSSMASLDLSDEGMLRVLDSQCTSLSRDLERTDKRSVIPRSLGRAYLAMSKSFEMDEVQAPSFAQFIRLEETESNWSGMSDAALLKRLLAVAPEESETFKKAIARFLEGS